MKKSDKKYWYALALGTMVVKWEDRFEENPKGRLVKTIYLIKNASVESVVNKANVILDAVEDNTGNMICDNAYKCVIKKVGIFAVEQLLEELGDGVEIYEEAEDDVDYEKASREVIGNDDLNKMISLEKENGHVMMFGKPYWGEEFKEL